LQSICGQLAALSLNPNIYSFSHFGSAKIDPPTPVHVTSHHTTQSLFLRTKPSPKLSKHTRHTLEWEDPDTLGIITSSDFSAKFLITHGKIDF